MPDRKFYLEDIPLAEVQKRIRDTLQSSGRWEALSAEIVPLSAALARVLTEPITAKISSPHFHCAAMDGYAVNAADTLGATETQPLTLFVDQNTFPVNTGDPLPERANAVIMIEHVQQIDEKVIQIYAPLTPWQHVRLMGEDILATETVLQINHQIRPVDLGMLAACGHTQVPVRRKPRVIIIPTGSELISADTIPQRGQLIEYNSLILSGQIIEAGGLPTVTDIVPDNYDQLLDVVLKAVQEKPELILVLSGSSAGSRDFTAHIVQELGELLVHGVAVRPGHPVIFGTVNDIPIIGVPGYPVSAALTGEIFIVPLIYQWLGIVPPEKQTIDAVSTRKITSPTGDDDFVRVAVSKIENSFRATPLQRGAGVLTSLVEADGLAHIPRFSEGVDAGQTIRVQLYRPLSEILKTVMVIGSHDPMLNLLATYLRKHAPGHRMVSVNAGSIGGLVAIRRGEAHLAGIHLFDPETQTYNIPYLKKYLGDDPIRLVTFAHREQGLIVPAGNPHNVKSIKDIQSLRYVNRQRGAGTRLLLDYLLQQHQIEPENIRGYDHEEYTHLAVAAAVADGIGDCGMGVFQAAHAMGLDFISITQERYDLVIPQRFLDHDGVQVILDLLDNETFKAELNQQPGYSSDQTGRVWIE
ncbi:MAG: molybdopterin biosynthesis protein [Anaerolineae bacterium]|nr:molybdopterin biosynthesis protein [Anaerolineae bacterium]